jgi:hypothetical protein
MMKFLTAAAHSELREFQIHDPTVVLLPGGSYIALLKEGYYVSSSMSYYTEAYGSLVCGFFLASVSFITNA